MRVGRCRYKTERTRRKTRSQEIGKQADEKDKQKIKRGSKQTERKAGGGAGKRRGQGKPRHVNYRASSPGLRFRHTCVLVRGPWSVNQERVKAGKASR